MSGSVATLFQIDGQAESLEESGSFSSRSTDDGNVLLDEDEPDGNVGDRVQVTDGGQAANVEQFNDEILTNSDEEVISETSSVLSPFFFDEVDQNKYTKLRILLTNARSLSPKIMSLINYFEELDLTIAIITESWLADGKTLDDDLAELELGTNLTVIYKNSPVRPTSRRSSAGGGEWQWFLTKRSVGWQRRELEEIILRLCAREEK